MKLLYQISHKWPSRIWFLCIPYHLIIHSDSNFLYMIQTAESSYHHYYVTWIRFLYFLSDTYTFQITSLNILFHIYESLKLDLLMIQDNIASWKKKHQLFLFHLTVITLPNLSKLHVVREWFFVTLLRGRS